MAKYSDRVVERASSRKGYVGGWYKVRCTNAQKQPPHEETGNLRSTLQFSPLRSDDTEVKPSIKVFSTWPLENEEVPGHEAPETEWNTIPLMQALFPKECPLYPQTDKKTKKLMFDGKPIDKEEINEKKKEASIKALDKCVAVEEDPSLCIGKECYAKVFWRDGSDWPNLGNFCLELPPGQTLVEDEEMKGYVSAEASAGGKKKADAKASKSSSKTSKKKGRFGR